MNLVTNSSKVAAKSSFSLVQESALLFHLSMKDFCSTNLFLKLSIIFNCYCSTYSSSGNIFLNCFQPSAVLYNSTLSLGTYKIQSIVLYCGAPEA